MPEVPNQNQLFDVHDRLAGASDEGARWLAAQAIFSSVGADWVTAGTAPMMALHSVAVATSTPSSLMADYIRERIHETDPWMSHSSICSAIDEVNLEDRHGTALLRGEAPILDVFMDHGVRQVTLVPAWTGSRPGAVVLYATAADSAAALRDVSNRDTMRRLVDIVAAWFRPERLTGQRDDIYAIRPILNRRELEALQWLSLGLRTAEIGWKMGVENVTVSKHFASARRKLCARTREQALAIAIRDGLIQL